MSEVSSFFRICPACGKRFHIKLVDRKAISSYKDKEGTTQAFPLTSPVWRGQGAYATMPFIVEENVPVTIDIEEFNYSYRCKHCGHEWSEKRVEEHRER
jgi:hypothetical protein